MKSLTINLEGREETGTVASKRYRKAGFIPAVVYSHGEKSVSALLKANEFIKVASTVRSAQIFTFESKHSELNGRSAIVKEVQKDYLANYPIHVDFQAIKENESLNVLVTLTFVGEAPGVKTDGGLLAIATHQLGVSCLPKYIPDHIDVDVSQLKIGESIHASQLKMPEGVKLSGNPEETIVSVVVSKAIEVEAPKPAEGEAAAAAAGAEGAAAPAEGAAEGAAPAKDAKAEKAEGEKGEKGDKKK